MCKWKKKTQKVRLGLTDTACKISPLQLFVVYKSCSTSLAEHFPHIFLTHQALNYSLFSSHPQHTLFCTNIHTHVGVQKNEAFWRYFRFLHFLRWPSYLVFPLFISILTSLNVLLLVPQIASPNDLIKSPNKSIAMVTNAQKNTFAHAQIHVFTSYKLLMDIRI